VGRSHTITWDEQDGPRTSRFLVLGVLPAGHGSQAIAWWEKPVHSAICEWPQGAGEPTSYWLSNLPAGMDVQRLVALAKLRRRTGPDRAALEQLVLGHADGWSLPAWHSHVTLVSLARGFLLLQRGRTPERRRPSARRALGRRPVRRREPVGN
jgi:SRSO17 transposase